MRGEVYASLFSFGRLGCFVTAYYEVILQEFVTGIIVSIFCDHLLQAFFCRPNAGLRPPV